MKTYLVIATIVALVGIKAINLDSLNTLKNQASVVINDGPTNGDMTEDEKDSLIQVLCPGNVQTSFTQTAGKSSTCNSGAKAGAKALVQETETVGDL